MSLRKLPIIATLFFLALLAPAATLWAEETDAAESAAETAEPEAQPKDETEAEAAPAGSPGMSLPFDGKSTEAFEKSLAKIEAETTAAEYTTVQNALDYLLVYDLAARGDRDVLYQRLDGKTPNDVLDMVKWRQEGRKREKR